MIDKSADKAPHPIDVYVGTRIRQCRKALNVTQDELAQKLDLTFQQVQKYERGANRVSASKLWEISRALSVSIGYFFEGYDEPRAVNDFEDIASERTAQSFLMTSEGVELAEAFPRVKNAKLRRKVAELVRELASDVVPKAI